MPKFIRFSNQIIRTNTIKRIFLADLTEVRLIDNDDVVYSIICADKIEAEAVFQSYLNILSHSRNAYEIGRVILT